VPDYLFVTGKLAADALSDTLEAMEPDFEYEIEVLGISVAALMSAGWIARHLNGARECDQVMISGWVQGDLAIIEEKLGVPVILGPKDLKDIPVFFGRERVLAGYGEYEVKILGEIVEAYRMPWEELLARAEYFRASGADIIDLGCPVGMEQGFPGVGEVVAGLKEHGFTVSLDTFHHETILRADEAGLDMLLSINSTNMALAPQLNTKIVVIPDFDQGLESLERNIAQLEDWGVPYVIDPIVNPINFGFAECLHRFYETRQRHPEAEMLMGVANLTELTDADTTGINAVMAGFVTELNIDYVLMTEVISWAKGAVREFDLARKLMYYSHKNNVLPKHVDDGLITIKDPPHESYTEAELRHMQEKVRDRNFRIFANSEYVYVFNNTLFIKGTDPQQIFDQLGMSEGSHAFYLGRELERAALAVHLGKKYTQEAPLRWGYLSEDADKVPSEWRRPADRLHSDDR
jgi:dihydropteroate synthase-like protein